MTSVLLLAGALTLSSAAEPELAGSALRRIIAEEWEFTLRESPEFASRLGDRRANDRWTDDSLEAHRRRQEHRLQVLKELDAIDGPSLSGADRLDYTLFRRQVEDEVERHRYGLHLLPLNQRGGVQTANELGDTLRFETVRDYEDWIARLRGIPAQVDQTIELMREGIAAGMVHARVIMERIPEQIEAQIVEEPEESLFFDPFERFPDAIPDADRERLAGEALAAIRDRVVPAYRKLGGFFEAEYLPACYEKAGFWQVPRGREMYGFLARSYTTTGMSPEEIHRIGMEEVKRIRGEMEAIIAGLDFKGSFEEFLQFLRTDRRFYYDDPDELLAAYRALSKAIDPTLVKLFRTIPRIPYGVEPIPDAVAPDTTTAYYREPAADGTRAGTYFVNLYRPEVRPRYEMEALSLHEAVPGHHFQIARAMELGDLPPFRRYGGYTAFVEGWALYAESLGGELGFYKDPYSKFGQLTYEMWRAVRLVVDTGIHFLQWPRSKAIDFFLANAAKTEHDIVNEIDRYIAWPGQALAYKIGELKIKELRARAERDLGDRFDVRDFHEAILGSGAIPLDVLEEKINGWIAEVRGQVSQTGGGESTTCCSNAVPH